MKEKNISSTKLLFTTFVVGSLCALIPSAVAMADSATADSLSKTSFAFHLVSAEGVGEAIGSVELSDSKDGLQITTDLKNLPAGVHGFHLHEKGSCEPGEKDGKIAAAIGAGGHYDPEQKKLHSGPMGSGHKGDMPSLTVAADGTAKETLIAPHLKVSDTVGRAFIIHKDGDNYSDTPAPLGGGGARIACGIVK